MSKRLVLVRAYGDKAVIREVLKEEGDVVVVCRPENADAIRAGTLPEPSLAVRRSDVFAYDDEAARDARRGRVLDWSRLRPAL